jgi:hypothetical protein
MKNLLMLWQTALEELGAGCDRSYSTTQDLKTVLSRSETEGSSFLTITLPTFGKELEKALALGKVSTEQFRGWKKLPTSVSSSGLPCFLSGFMTRIFDRDTGVLLAEPDVEAIFSVRQLTLMFSKILLPCSDARTKAAIDGYVECEKEIRRNDASFTPELLEEFRVASLRMYGTVFQQVDEDIHYGRIVPGHGPGATADRLKGNRKFDQREWTERLDAIFPFGEHIVPNYRYHFDILQGLSFLEPGSERPVRVITVPKTLKTPRIIAIEPTCMQYMQQGLMASLVPKLEKALLPTQGGAEANHGFWYVGFSDQEPNQLLAKKGSSDGSLATLDLSEASDRVSNQLVRTMFATFPNLQAGVDATRSRKADVPGHGVIRLAKFASMGSALTFPIEALVFSTIAMMAIARELNTSVTGELCQKLRGQVRVYGDDIIVPTDYAVPVSQLLETFGFRVNRDKSFWTGKFRESCGKEFYDGQSVSIAKVRRELPTELAHVEEIISAVSLRNQFYQLGMWLTAGWLDSKLDRILRGNYPLVLETSPVLGRVSVCFGYETQRMHRTLHAPQVRGYVATSQAPLSELNDVGALLKCLLKQGEEPFADSRHLQRGGRPDAVNIKLRWNQPF